MRVAFTQLDLQNSTSVDSQIILKKHLFSGFKPLVYLRYEGI